MKYHVAIMSNKFNNQLELKYFIYLLKNKSLIFLFILKNIIFTFKKFAVMIKVSLHLMHTMK